MNLLADLQKKDIIALNDGSILGTAIDVELEPSTGQIISLIVSKHRTHSLFSQDPEILIPWEQIVKIGTEVIFVKSASGLDPFQNET
ncbi:YlmC/YmxH family sporulation protein [Peribacillus sp. SCS-37]|uniref:YlmC/YmxH family sporulation protein n=1 Tax=Paraperibacillus esterisolvens TaxID=3115296 RepID=UPI0039057826